MGGYILPFQLMFRDVHGTSAYTCPPTPISGHTLWSISTGFRFCLKEDFKADFYPHTKNTKTEVTPCPEKFGHPCDVLVFGALENIFPQSHGVGGLKAASFRNSTNLATEKGRFDVKFKPRKEIQNPPMEGPFCLRDGGHHLHGISSRIPK